MDFDLYEQLNGLADRHHTLQEAFRFFAQEGQILFLLLLAAIFFARGKWRSRNGRHGVVAAGFSAVLALGIAQVIASLWDRPRPYEAHPGDAHLLLVPSPDPSFPSDHATGAYAIAVAILLRHRKGSPRAHPRHARCDLPRRTRHALPDRRPRRCRPRNPGRPAAVVATHPPAAAPSRGLDWRALRPRGSLAAQREHRSVAVPDPLQQQFLNPAPAVGV